MQFLTPGSNFRGLADPLTRPSEPLSECLHLSNTNGLKRLLTLHPSSFSLAILTTLRQPLEDCIQKVLQKV